MATEVTTTDIATASLEPKRIQGDQGEVENRPIDDLIKAQDRAAGAAAIAAGGCWGAVSRTRVVPPGAVGPCS